jgi:hypothetical protein
MTKGMTPSGHTRSGLDVAARRLRGLPLHLPRVSLCDRPLVLWQLGAEEFPEIVRGRRHWQQVSGWKEEDPKHNKP